MDQIGINNHMVTHMVWLKNCCSFSLTRLMQICSNVLNSKISNPGEDNVDVDVHS